MSLGMRTANELPLLKMRVGKVVHLRTALTSFLLNVLTVYTFEKKLEISVKPADKPDFVRRDILRWPGVTAINLGRESPARLGATYPPTQRNHLNVGLFGIAARRDCPFHPAFEVAPKSRLVSVALILTSRWRGVTSYAVLCSPDVPPVPGFPYGTSGGLACFTGWIIPVI